MGNLIKDIDKAYNMTAKCIKVFNRNGRLLLYSEPKHIGHFGVVRDYTIKLKYGGELWIDYGVIKELVEHELKENRKSYKDLL